MYLTHLSLTQFRNFSRLDIDLPTGTTLIVGANAQGKTSILEAVYFLAALSSFPAESDRQLINLIEGRKKLAVARIFQHEVDHLNGVLFTDRAEKVYTMEEAEEQFEGFDPTEIG